MYHYNFFLFSLLPAFDIDFLFAPPSFAGLTAKEGTLKTVSHVEQMGINLQKMDKQTEHTNPTSTNFLWQKHAAR